MKERVLFKNNAFDVIRLIAALCIMTSHYCVTVIGSDCDTRYLFAGDSLVVFFLLCGFLLFLHLQTISTKAM